MNEITKKEEKWYTIDELAELTGISVETLKGGQSPLNNFNIGNKTDIKTGGYRNRQKFYSENVLEALKQYQIKTGTSNAMKNKEIVQQNIVKNVSELTYNATLEQIKQSFGKQYDALSDYAKEIIARDLKLNMQNEAIMQLEADNHQLAEDNMTLYNALEYDKVKDCHKWSDVKKALGISSRVSFESVASVCDLEENKDYYKKVMGKDKYPTIMLTYKAEMKIKNYYS